MQENTQTLSRRDLMKAGCCRQCRRHRRYSHYACCRAGCGEADAGIRWQKGVCPLRGTGCGLQVGTLNGRVVATKGDPEAPVNRGLNCIKGYFNAKILYGKDRLTQPLMRKKNGQIRQERRFEPVSWEEALDEMEKQLRRAYQAKGPEGTAIGRVPASTRFRNRTAPVNS